MAAQFAAGRQWSVLAGLGTGGHLWTTMLTGPAGFLRAVGEHDLAVRARPRPADPLFNLATAGGDVGMLLMDDHRRMRVNGAAEPTDGGFVIHADQVFSNCGRYIAGRLGTALDALPPEISQGRRLTWAQRALIEAADTFFIGTRHPSGDADASHRGGNPGFVRVAADDRLSWPDYDGNKLFMTLGNIALDPRVGLLFLDWTRGTLLQVAGRAEIDWSPGAAGEMPGAQRVVHLHVEAVRQSLHGVPMTWSTAVMSRFSPVLASAVPAMATAPSPARWTASPAVSPS